VNHSEARAFSLEVSPELTPAESQFARAVMGAETGFGGGWVGLAKKLGVENPEQFANVNNFGAITSVRPTPETAFFMRDRWWRKYPDQATGWKDAVRTILKPNVRAAVNRGDGAAAVKAMGDNGYYIEPKVPKAKQVAQYTTFIQNSHQHLLAATGEPSLLSWTGNPGQKIGDFLEAAVYVGGVLGAIWLFAGGAAKDE